MTDLVLISPTNQKNIYGELALNLSGIEPPLWAALIAAHVRSKGFSVTIIDAGAENFSPEEAAARALQLEPLLVGIVVSGTNPSASTMNMPGAGMILRELKNVRPELKTLLAGLHPSSLPERTLREEAVDFVCQGEGFSTFVGLIEQLKKADRFRDFQIKGLWHRKGGEIVCNPREELLPDLDVLPFAAWDLLPMGKYRAHNWHCFQDIEHRQPYAVIYTSLGCPFQCSFCCINSIFGKNTIRYRSPKWVVEEIGILVRDYQVKNIKIMDEMFAFNEPHVLEICEGIIREGFDLNIWAYARIDTISDKMLKKMKKAGFRWLAFGIESGDEDVLHGVIKGRFGRKEIFDTIHRTQNAGIYVGANYIFGLPNDNLETMNRTLQMAEELNCEYANFYAAMAYPGSKLYADAVQKGLRLPENWLGYAQYGEDATPLATRFLSGAEILHFRDRAIERYFGRKEYLEMIERKFGSATVEHIREMLKVKIKRKNVLMPSN